MAAPAENVLGKAKASGKLDWQKHENGSRRISGDVRNMSIRSVLWIDSGQVGPGAGFTLAEVLLSIAIAAISIGGIIYGYIVAAQQTEWSACSAAAQMMAMQRLEQTRAAKWDPLGNPPVDDVVEENFTNVIANLNVPLNGTNAVPATNTTTIAMITTNPPLKMIRVDCTWSLMNRGPFTNTVISYRAPDQ